MLKNSIIDRSTFLFKAKTTLYIDIFSSHHLYIYMMRVRDELTTNHDAFLSLLKESHQLTQLKFIHIIIQNKMMKT